MKQTQLFAGLCLSVMFGIAFLVSGCCATNCKGPQVRDGKLLTASEWVLDWSALENGGMKFESEEPITLFFTEEGRCGGFSGVNRYMGDYELESDELEFERMASTRMGGAPQAMAFESAYLKLLDEVDDFFVICDEKGKTLYLLEDNVVVAKYKPAQPEATATAETK